MLIVGLAFVLDKDVLCAVQRGGDGAVGKQSFAGGNASLRWTVKSPLLLALFESLIPTFDDVACLKVIKERGYRRDVCLRGSVFRRRR